MTGLLNEKAGNCRVDVSASEDIDRVEFFLDGKPLNVERYAPYACLWDTRAASLGTHVLKAVAYDTAGNASSDSVSVQVGSVGAPTITLTSPVSGATFKKYLLLESTAKDDSKVTKVEYRLDGKLVHTEYGAPYHAYWDGGAVAYGDHTVVARAYDNSGLWTDSARATVTRVR